MIGACRKVVHSLQSLLPETDEGILILAYHIVDGGTGAPVDIPFENFKQQLEELRERAVVCSFEEALQRLQNRNISRGPFVVITFDDAYENFYTTAWPLLQKLKMPSLLYVPVDFVEGTIPPPIKGSNGLKPCSWSQLGEMLESGLLTIGSHSCSHVNLKALDLNLAQQEIEQSRKRLENNTGRNVDSFCYPKGLWSRRIEKIVQRNYRTAVIGGGRRIFSANWNPYRLYRVPIRRDMPRGLRPVLSTSVWIEEYIASGIRSWLPRS